ncbi:hypothetical protein [Actinacidiphila acididurans]|uniref:Uncharacterized protein n=1 Tax=Actinacidiphila acididurans TaxID=2784346 RepID=A0ABS2TPM1_9ACTN|nr:hypothetical protein [Actinacidiphila acididurans]MBM9505292.1 hypothetical protein [Actinacidiphila acididurans]
MAELDVERITEISKEPARVLPAGQVQEEPAEGAARRAVDLLSVMPEAPRSSGRVGKTSS